MCHFSTCPLTSRYVIAHDQFYQAFPALVLQATNAEVRRPGYNASTAGDKHWGEKD